MRRGEGFVGREEGVVLLDTCEVWRGVGKV